MTTAPIDYSGSYHGPLTQAGDYAFSQMVAFAESLNMPRAFRRDLYVHDYQACASLAPRFATGEGTEFAWGISETGTVFVPAAGSGNLPTQFDDAFGGALWSYFDGRTLTRGSVAYVTRKLENAREYSTFLRNQRRIAQGSSPEAR